MVGIKPTELAPTVTIKFFGAGTAACIADLVTFPLDTAKVRLQIQGESKAVDRAKGVRYRGVFGTITTMVRTEGPRSPYNGLVAGLQRQMSFASVRIGLYDSMKQFYTRGSERAMAVAFAQPTDVVKVRFQAQVRLADGTKRYNGTMDAYRTIAREEGIRGLWKELVTYDIIKELILKYDLMTVDVVKTRFMNSAPGQYSNAVNCTITMLTQEGPTAFYKGYVYQCPKKTSLTVFGTRAFGAVTEDIRFCLIQRLNFLYEFLESQLLLKKNWVAFICLVFTTKHQPFV
ncbi:hypothetical protein COCON_G00084080 [Conger conger]|uniref:Mitochondrial uncoupling protein n=1 Tax=Conger conger TaxID=82655 RepID=A0A9Q1DQD4_CONCO|nr:hypothetical protein COCON_G00084080 [Conger conger]